MHDYLKLMANHMAAGLRKKSITTCSKWAESFRVLGGKDYPGPWRFKHHPWLKAMHDSEARMNIGQKSAQMGFTETVLNRTFYKIDMQRVDCLYVLPAQTPDAHDFSSARFNPALELSPYLASLFADVDNVGHKRAGSTNLYIRGSKSRSGLKSVPVGFLVLDEVNEMNQDNISLAMERQSGQLTKECWLISTPTSDGFGINEYFQASTQEHFFFKCPHCSRHTELIYPECVEITAQEVGDEKLRDSFYKCKECKAKLEHRLKHEWLVGADWVPGFTNYDDRGFYVNQMYSPTITPAEFAKSALQSQHNIADEQEFWNSKLGLAHTPEGSRINDKHIEACIGNYFNREAGNGIITMGVDVGKWLHLEIDQWTLPDYSTVELNTASQPKVLLQTKVQSFEELDYFMQEYRINACVIDAQPERRKAFEFATRNYGRVKMCFYGRGIQGKQIHESNEVEPTITVDRTSWLDLSLSRFRSGRIQIPRDTNEEYKQHLKSLVRITTKDSDGNPIGSYEKKTNDHDHYAHARNYAELALPFAICIGENQDIREY